MEKLLESVKEFRDHTVAGAIVLLSCYVLLRDRLNRTQLGTTARTEGLGLVKAVGGDISGTFGNSGRLAAFLVSATIVGIVGQQLFRAPAIWLGNLSLLIVGAVEQAIVRLLSKLSHRPVPRRYNSWPTVAVDPARRFIRVLPNCTLNYEQMDRRWRSVLAEDSAKNPAGAASQHDDRAGTRYALVCPMVILTIALSVRVSPWCAVVSALPLMIAFQAAEHRLERDRILLEGVQ